MMNCSWQSKKEAEVATQDFDMERLKVFNVHSVRSVLIAKLDKKQSKREMQKLMSDTVNGGNLMLINVQNAFSTTNIDELKNP